MPAPKYSRDDVSPAPNPPSHKKPQPQPTAPFKPGSGKGNNGNA